MLVLIYIYNCPHLPAFKHILGRYIFESTWLPSILTQVSRCLHSLSQEALA